ncbi:hypothetical protein ACRQ1B_27120 [Rhizobium panacihumi]|uniref:hypothetical protein n=1 Tax=Rhizobium panacihumi TaxID=2008450 RepID=UPI003D7B4213
MRFGNLIFDMDKLRRLACKDIGLAMISNGSFEKERPAAEKLLGSATDWLNNERDVFIAKVRLARETLTQLHTDGEHDLEGFRQQFVEAVAMYKAVRASWARLQSFDGVDQLKLLRKKLSDVKPQVSSAVLSDFVDDLASIPQEFVQLNDQYNAMRRRFSHDRVIFVDIEVAFSNFRFCVGMQHSEQTSTAQLGATDLQLDPSSVGLLSRLCTKANAKLVLTSSWRKSWLDGRQALVSALIEEGLSREIWHPEWMIPVCAADGKWNELPKWLNWSSSSVALVIDSGRPPADTMPLLAKKASLLLIDALDGFGGRDYFRALEFFGAEDAEKPSPLRLAAKFGLQRYPTLLQRGESLA